MKSKALGTAGENAAKKYLEKHGYVIIAENYISNGYELDAVAFRRGTLAFCEVKTRSGDLFGRPKDAVDTVKQRRIRSAASGFMYEQVKNRSVPVYCRLLRRMIKRRVRRIRFDVAEIYLKNGEYTVNYLENYF